MKKKIYTSAIALFCVLAFSACGGGSLSRIVIDEESTTDIAKVYDKEENKIKGVTFEAVDAETKYNELKSASRDDVVEVTFAYKKGSEEEMKTIGSQINYIMADLSIMERD